MRTFAALFLLNLNCEAGSQDMLSEWLKEVDSSSISKSCVGSNLTGVIFVVRAMKSDKLYLTKSSQMTVTARIMHCELRDSSS